MPDPLDEAFAAYLHARDQGEQPSRDEFLGQYPQVADRLRELMTAADSLDRFVGPEFIRVGSLDSAVHFRAAGGSKSTAFSGEVRSETESMDGAAETVDLADRGETGSPVTLPIARRAEGDPGPTLPYQLGDYRLLSILGRGGMGVVYLATQDHLNRQVAVKMIRSGILAGESEVKRFYSEAKAAAKLEHRNIVSIFQIGHLSGHHYFSMEYVPGTDLSKKIRQAPLAPRDAARYVRDVARAIQHAHERKVLHRDLKPANVLIDPDDAVRVTDFGLAKHIDSDSSMTGSGAVIGTPNYMAPEQASGYSDRASPATDVYGLGAILFAAITGRPPFSDPSPVQTMLQVVHQPAPRLRSLCPEAPEDLDTVIAKCLEKQPERRYRTAGELADELDAYLDGRPIAARPWNRLTRVCHWLLQVPLVAALCGRRVITPTVVHRRFQTALLAAAMLTPFFLVGGWAAITTYQQRMPTVVRLAGGLDGGAYESLSRELAGRLERHHGVRAEVIRSSGSLDNRDRLLRGEIAMAPMQAGAMTSESLCVLAPLFYEAVHVLARSDSGVDSIDSVIGHSIAVGPLGSGSRLVAEMVLESLSIPLETTPRVVTHWPDLNTSTGPDVAVVCIGKGSQLVATLLKDDRWKLLPVPSAIQVSLEHPVLRPMTIQAIEYPGANIPEEGVATVGTTAFLAATKKTPDALVAATLHSLYDEPIAGLIQWHQVKEWQGLAFHPAARRYFDQK